MQLTRRDFIKLAAGGVGGAALMVGERMLPGSAGTVEASGPFSDEDLEIRFGQSPVLLYNGREILRLPSGDYFNLEAWAREDLAGLNPGKYFAMGYQWGGGGVTSVWPGAGVFTGEKETIQGLAIVTPAGEQRFFNLDRQALSPFRLPGAEAQVSEVRLIRDLNIVDNRAIVRLEVVTDIDKNQPPWGRDMNVALGLQTGRIERPFIEGSLIGFCRGYLFFLNNDGLLTGASLDRDYYQRVTDKVLQGRIDSQGQLYLLKEGNELVRYRNPIDPSEKEEKIKKLCPDVSLYSIRFLPNDRALILKGFIKGSLTYTTQQRLEKAGIKFTQEYFPLSRWATGVFVFVDEKNKEHLLAIPQGWEGASAQVVDGAIYLRQKGDQGQVSVHHQTLSIDEKTGLVDNEIYLGKISIVNGGFTIKRHDGQIKMVKTEARSWENLVRAIISFSKEHQDRPFVVFKPNGVKVGTIAASGGPGDHYNGGDVFISPVEVSDYSPPPSRGFQIMTEGRGNAPAVAN